MVEDKVNRLKMYMVDLTVL